MIRSAAVLFALLLCASAISAEPAESLEQAKTLSAEQGKPILLEFVHED